MVKIVTFTCGCGKVVEYRHVNGRFRTRCSPECKGNIKKPPKAPKPPKPPKPVRPTEVNCTKCGTTVPVKPIGHLPTMCKPCRSYKPKTEPQEAAVQCVRCEELFNTFAYPNGRLPKYCDPCREDIEQEKEKARIKRAEYKATPPEVLAKERVDHLEMLLKSRNSHISQHPELR